MTPIEIESERKTADNTPFQNDFLRRSATSSHAMTRNTKQRYTMLASAIAGRQVGIVQQTGKAFPTYTDGAYIYLPGGRDNLRLEVMVQAAIIANGAIDKRYAKKLTGRSKGARRFLYLEVLRAVNALSDRLPRMFTGQPVFTTTSPLTPSAKKSLHMSLSPIHLPDPPEFFGTLRPVQILKASFFGGENGTPIADPMNGSFDTHAMEELVDEQETEDVKFLKLFENPLFSGGFLEEMLRDILGMKPAPGKNEEEGQGAGGRQTVVRKASWLKRGMKSLISMIPVEIPAGVLAKDPGGITYPEWDEFRQCYRPDWTTIQEYDVWHSEEKRDVTAIVKPPTLPLRRSLARIGLGHERHRHQPQGDNFGIDDLVRLLVDVRTGQIPDERIYSDVLRTRRDLGILVLLDMSSSVSDDACDGGCVFDLQARAAYQVVQVLDDLGDRVAFYTFFSIGRNLVRLLRVKSFDERMNGSAIDRMSHLKPMGYTRLGAAVRHGATIVKNPSGSSHQLLLLITDGYTYDEGYEGVYGEADARRAIEEVRDQGIGVVCLNIGGVTEEKKLHSIFGSSCHMSVQRPEDMHERLGDLFKNAIGEVMWNKAGGNKIPVP